MLQKYVIEIKHTPKYKNGAFRKSYVPLDATTSHGALQRALRSFVDEHKASKETPEIFSIEVAKGPFPKSKRQRFKLYAEAKKPVVSDEELKRIVDERSYLD